MTTFNVIFDESGKKDKSHIVYAGFMFDPAVWNEFSRQWKALLYPHAISVFHATDAFAFAKEWKTFRGRPSERDDLLRALANLCLEFPRECSASIIGTDDFKQAPKHIRDRYKNDPFYAAFEQWIKAAVEHSDTLPEDNFNLICDDSEETAEECLRVYRRLRKEHPQIARRIGFLGFADDEKFPALQMADMWAACLRRQAECAPDGVWRELLDIFSR